MRIAQIFENRVHFIFESDSFPEVDNKTMLIDISNRPEIDETWGYNIYEKKFIEPTTKE
jgi:hypothetical protein